MHTYTHTYTHSYNTHTLKEKKEQAQQTDTKNADKRIRLSLRAGTQLSIIFEKFQPSDSLTSLFTIVLSWAYPETGKIHTYTLLHIHTHWYHNHIG